MKISDRVGPVRTGGTTSARSTLGLGAPTTSPAPGVVPFRPSHTRTKRAAGLDALEQKTRLDSVNRALSRSVDSIWALRRPDGSWWTPFRGGSVQMALASVALADIGASDAVTGRQNEALLAAFAATQRPDGGFPIVVGEPSSAAATRLVALAVAGMAKAGNVTAQDVARRCAAFLKVHPKSARDDMYGAIAAIVSDCVSGKGDFAPNLPLVAMLTSIGTAVTGDRLSGLARVYAPAIGLLAEAQARKDSRLARVIGKIFDLTGVREDLVHELTRSQDSDGAWGWTIIGTALALMALRRNGYSLERSRSMQRGVAFLQALRDGDVSNWTRGDTWDTGYAALTLGAVDPSSAKKLGPSIDELLHGQLEDGRFSFSLPGQLGDNDTTSTTLRALSLRLEGATDKAERDRLRTAISHCVRGLLKYQQSGGGWAAFNARSLPGFSSLLPPGSGTESATNDVQSPDLTGRVLISLVRARESGALDKAQTARVDAAETRAKKYLIRARNDQGSWWSRWIAGRLSGFAFVVPALRQAGEAPTSKVFAKTPALLLATQNADGGWGEEVAADRDPSHHNRGASSVVHTFSAIIGLIGTAAERNPALDTAIGKGIDWILRHEKNGTWTNGRPLYTALSGVDYYDTDLTTTCFATSALALYRDYLTVGPDAAIKRARI